ncbi:mitochondrial ribosomal protein L16 [Lycorma delicatula]|uniref:mitochondrial ribosomal protein L16 n=1 Tax=Lycorma delicatula TaxID=130591 RepID=UPI003F50F585
MAGVIKSCLRLNGKTFIPLSVQAAGVKYFPPPNDYSGIEIPEKPRLTVVPRTPTYSANVRTPRMNKCLNYMRGPELIHDKLLHEQYGIIALHGGRLKYGHFEMIRNTLGRKIDMKRMFLVWRVDPPWQPITRKSQGARMGGGKGNIHHYVSPVKANRVIVELAGKCDFEEVKPMLEIVAHILPFKAMVVNQKILEERAAAVEREEKENINRYTLKYLIQNNIQNCRREFRQIDLQYFGKYV